MLGIDDENAENLVLNISADLNDRKSGLTIVKMDKKYQICTKKEYAEQVRDILDLKRNAPLSQAAFEVLAVIAYNQPITKAYIEQVRGVDCSGVISTLCQKGLIEEVGRLELPGRPLIYGTTADFLKCFCISSLDDLPDVQPINVAARAIAVRAAPTRRISILPQMSHLLNFIVHLISFDRKDPFLPTTHIIHYYSSFVCWNNNRNEISNTAAGEVPGTLIALRRIRPSPS